MCVLYAYYSRYWAVWGLIDEKELVLGTKEVQATGRDEEQAGNQKQVGYAVEELRRKRVHVTMTPYEAASLITHD